MEVNKMIAVQGVYDNGRIQLSEAAPMEKAKVAVVFPEAKKIEKKQMIIDTAKNYLRNLQEA